MKTVLTPHDYRQRDALMMVERHFPTVTVAKMREDGFLQIRLFILGSLFGSFQLRCDFLPRFTLMGIVGIRGIETGNQQGQYE